MTRQPTNHVSDHTRWAKPDTTLNQREQRVLHPEDTFERAILQCLESGTLQNLMSGSPPSITHSFLRVLAGGFMKLSPAKKALMTDMLRSSFLRMMRKGDQNGREHRLSIAPAVLS